MKIKYIASFFAASLLLCAVPAMAAGDQDHAVSPAQGWGHAGMMGLYDRAAAQRGLQVYREVCSSCHGLDYVAFRTLMNLGFTEDEVKALAAEYEVEAAPDMDGEVAMRPGIPADYFPAPYPNKEAAKASNNGAAPPDLSLMAKKRLGGEDYIYSLMNGYRDPTEAELGDLEKIGGLPDTAYFNPYMPGKVIAMAPPLSDDIVEYSDGTKATVEQMAFDVATFLTWTAEPTMEERKRIGMQVMIYLLILCGLLYFAFKRVARRVHGH